MERRKDKSIFSEWLEKLQQESWQLELLISGFAIYGLFSFKDYFDETAPLLLAKFNSGLVTGVVVLILAPIYLGIILFISNLLIHVFVRGLWIGAIGLRYVSGDIEYGSLNYENRFLQFYKRKVGSFDEYIEKLERFASVIFSFTFLLFFIFISAFAFILYTVFSVYLITIVTSGEITNSAYTIGFNAGESKLTTGLLILFFVLHGVLGLMVFIDFITLGIFKKVRNKYFSKFYYWVFRYFGVITLSFLLRPLLLNFVDNKFTKKLLWLSIPYGILVGMFIPSLEYESNPYFPGFSAFYLEYKGDRDLQSEIFLASHYDEELERMELSDDTRIIHYCSLPSKRVRGNLIEIFLNKPKGFDRYFETLDDETKPFVKKGLSHLFNSNVIVDEERDETVALYREIIDARYEEFKLQHEDLDKKELRYMWRPIRRKFWKTFNDSIRNENRKDLVRVKEVFKSAYSFAIDSSIVAQHRLDCAFYIHPITSDKGLLCFLPVDSLTVGKHLLKVKVAECDLRVEDDFIVDTIQLTIPFAYEGDY